MHTIFFYAVYQKNTKLIIHLLENFADIILAAQDKDIEGRNIAHHFAEVGLLKAMDYIAKKPNLAVFLTKADKKGCTPFICAVLNNQTQIVSYLIHRGYADFASTAHASAFSGDLEKIKCLHQEKQLDKKDSLDVDVLGYAVSAGKTAVVNFLIENPLVLNYSKYPQLLIMSVELQHYKIAEMLFEKLHYSELIQQIPKFVALLASEKLHDRIEWLHARIIKKMRIPDAIVSHHPYFITGAIIHDSLPVFSFFIEKFFAEKVYTQSPTVIDNIFTLIDEYQRIRLTEALVNAFYPVAKENPHLTFQACRQIIKLNNPFFLDIFLHEIKKKDATHIKKITLQTNIRQLVDELFKSKNILNLLVLNQHLHDTRSQKNLSKDTIAYFEKINSKLDYPQLFFYYVEHYTFFNLANQLINQPNVTIHDYAKLSNILHDYKMIPENDFCIAFTAMALNSLMAIMKKKSNSTTIDWECLKKIYSDMQYITLTGQFNDNALILGLKKLIKLAFIFSDHAYIMDKAIKILNVECISGTGILTTQLMNLYLCQICSIFIAEFGFYPSNEVKKILLNEYFFIADGSYDCLFGIYLLSLIPQKTLSPKVNKKLLEKLSLLNIDKKNNDIHELMLSQSEILQIIHSAQIIYAGLIQLIQWLDDIQIERRDCFPVQDNSEQRLYYHIQVLQNYKMHYQLKIKMLDMLLALFQQLTNFLKKITLIIQSTANQTDIDLVLSELNQLKKTFFSAEIGENNLKKYQSDLAILCSTHLIAEEDLARYKQLKEQEKKQKKESSPQKIFSKSMITDTTEIKESSKNQSIKSPENIIEKKSIYTYHESSITTESTAQNNIPWIPANKKKTTAYQPVGHIMYNSNNSNNSKKIYLPIKPALTVDTVNKVAPKKTVQPKNPALLKKILMTSIDPFNIILTPEILADCGFPIELPDAVRRFFSCFLPNQLFLVGGAVRNALTAKTINDFDFIVFIAMDKIQQQFKNNYRIQGYGKKSIMVITYKGHEFDLLVIESETYQEALLHGSITVQTAPVLLKKEYQKRDFSINALYFNPYIGVIDVCGGLRDLLCKRKLRPITLNSAHFEIQHSIRILRGLRFAMQFDCTINAQLRRLMLQNISFLYTVTKIKLEKEYQNLVKLLGHVYAYQLYRHYYLTDLLINRGIPLTKPTWEVFWRQDVGLTLHPKDQQLIHIGQAIKNDLSQKDLASLAVTSRHYYRFFSASQKTKVTTKAEPLVRASKVW